MVGEEGFEPSTSASRTLRAKPSCATPRIATIVASAPYGDNQRGDQHGEGTADCKQKEEERVHGLGMIRSLLGKQRNLREHELTNRLNTNVETAPRSATSRSSIGSTSRVPAGVVGSRGMGRGPLAAIPPAVREHGLLAAAVAR